MAKTKSKLSTYQWELYNFIKEKSIEDSEHWVTHEEICERFPRKFQLNHQACLKKCSSRIQKEIIVINSSPEIEKIIIYKNQTYRVASSKEELDQFLETKFLNRAFRILKRYWQLKDKGEKDGQVKLLSARGDVIDDKSQVRKFIEAFINVSLTNETNTPF